MTKQEFLERFNQEQLNIGEYIMVFDAVVDDPLIFGCAPDKGLWKVYKTKERGGHYVIKEFRKEEDAFNYFYQAMKIFSQRLSEI